MILMQFVAEGGEKVKVESLDATKDRGKVRVFVDHGPAGVSSFVVPAGVVIGLATALVAGSPRVAPAVTERSMDVIETREDGRLVDVQFMPRDQAASDPAAESRGEVLDGVLPGLQL